MGLRIEFLFSPFPFFVSLELFSFFLFCFVRSSITFFSSDFLLAKSRNRERGAVEGALEKERVNVVKDDFFSDKKRNKTKQKQEKLQLSLCLSSSKLHLYSTCQISSAPRRSPSRKPAAAARAASKARRRQRPSRESRRGRPRRRR